MANLKEVKNRITSVQSTQQITKAMKMVAAAKLRKAQDNILQMRPYAQKFDGILKGVSASLDTDDNVFSEVRQTVNNVLIVAVTSDRGLCGPFNSNIFKATNTLIAEKYAEEFKEGSITILPIGRKSLDYFTKRNYKVHKGFSELFTNLYFDEAKKAAEFIMKSFEEQKFDVVEIVYNEFKNVATQLVCTEQFLPIVQGAGEANETSDYIYQPTQKALVDHLIPTSLKIQFYKALLESYASEHGARMTAMDKATENAGELLRDLKLKYNQTRQAAITNEILEIVAGAEALG